MARKKDNVKGCRKGGRNKAWCTVYRSRYVRLINKKVKLARHIRNFPADLQAKEVAINL